MRVPGQSVPASIAVLARIEALLAFLALYAAILVRFDTPLRALRRLELGPLFDLMILVQTAEVVLPGKGAR